MLSKDSIQRLFISIFVSILLTMFALMFTSDYIPAVLYIIKGLAAGAVIWFAGELLFPLCERLFPKSVLPGYIVVILLILTGTAGFAYILGLRSISVLLIILIAAEINGVTIIILFRRKYMKELNKNLERNKGKLE